jgi:DNA-binding winged helix-turn-helix (wHTH) protein/predicted ATPase
MSSHQVPPTGTPESLVFSTFQLDLRGGRLMRAGETLPLRPKTWGVLVYLAERPGVLVTKEELLDAVWPDIAVTPDTLTKSIGELRLALGDDSKTPRCIETVHRRGFRFIAPMLGVSAQVLGRENGGAGVGVPLDPDTRQLTPGPFVGRAAELRRLGELFAKASAGERQMVFVTGAAGVGKTTLIEAFLDSPAVRESASPVWIGRGCCIDQRGSREACMCVFEALERLVRRPDAERLLQLLRRAAPTWLVQMPWLVDDAEALRQSLQAARGERMLREFAALTEALTSDVTLVLVLEDLHWSDSSTVDLLSLLGQRREPARLMVIATYRPAEVAVQEHALSQAVRTLHVRRQCTELPVHELPLQDVQTYLEARFPGATFAAALAHVLHQHTDGHPLFIVAVIEHMLSRGWILDTAPGWALSISLEKTDLGVPEDARRMIETQFEGLSPGDRELLEAGSVAGVEFAPQAIAAALEQDADATEIQCERLARAHRFLRAVGTAEWPDGGVRRRYAFSHELYRQAVYADIPEGQRRRLHQRIGETLEAAYGERAREIAALLAVHFEQSRDDRRTIRYLAAAAAHARQRFASREAAGYLETALAVADRLPHGMERSRRELELRIALGPALNDLHGFASEAVSENCDRAQALCAEVGSPDQLFQILYALCHIHSVRADKALAPQAEANLERLARRLGTAEYRLLADTVAVRNAMHQGRCVDACRLAEERLPSLQSEHVPHLTFSYGADPLIGAQCHYAHALWMLGHVERAKVTMRESVAAAARGSLFTQAAALGQQGILAIFCRDAALVADSAEQLSSLSAEHSFRYWNAMATAFRGWTWIQQGRTREGISELQRALVALRADGARLFSTHILAFIAEAHLHSGAFAAALGAADEGLAIAEATLDRSYWPELWRLKGELLLARASSTPHQVGRDGRVNEPATATAESGWRDAERSLLRALKLARRSGAKSLELRAATSLARAWQGNGRGTDADAVLTEICRWFDADANSVDLSEARLVLTHRHTSLRRNARLPHEGPSTAPAPTPSAREGRKSPSVRRTASEPKNRPSL